MKRMALVLGVLLVCMGCSTRLTPGNLKGEWQFAYIIEGMAPPRFDKVEFLGKQQLRLRSSMDDQTLETTYSLTGEALTFEITSPEGAAHGESMGAAIGEYGVALTLQTQGTSLQFLRPGFMLRDDVAGTWTGDKELETLILTKDGKLHTADRRIKGYYRLWRSKLGKAITLVMDEPEHGTFAVSFVYKLRGEQLELVPVLLAAEIQKNPALAKDNPPIQLTRKP